MLAAFADDVKSTTEAKDEAALKAAQARQKEAEKLKAEADKRLDDAKKANQPKDVNFALVSTPIKLRVHATPIEIKSAAAAGEMKPDSKQPLTVEIERRYGFASDVELELDPPAGVKGLSIAKATLAKDQTTGKLEISAATDATSGQHACTLRARGKFNNVAFETTAAVKVTVLAKQ